MKFKHFRIADLLDEISMGPFGSNIKKECFVSSGIPVLNGSNLNDVAINDDISRYVTKEKADSLRKANARRGDIIVTHRGTLGQISFIPKTSLYERYIISQSQFRFRCNEKVLPEYLTYYFHTQRGKYDLLSNASQVGVPALARATTTFQQLELDIPSVKEQYKIVKILECIREKIELNNKINENLEKQAKAIFRHMFIDNINSNCKKGTLSDIADITMGQSPNGSSYNNDGNGTIFFQGRAEFGFRFPSVRLYTTEPKRMAYLNDTLMSVRAPVGDINVAHDDCCIGRGLAAIHSKSNHQSFVLYTMFFLKKQLDIFNSEGTVFGSINRNSLNDMPILIPKNELLDEFEKIVAPMDLTIRNNFNEIFRLQNIRDILLPRLMSGEIDVSEIEF